MFVKVVLADTMVIEPEELGTDLTKLLEAKINEKYNLKVRHG